MTLLLYFLKTLIIFKTFFSAFFVFLIYKPGRKFLSFIFHKILVKLYSWYLIVAKRLGFEGVKNRFIFTLNQKSVHFLVIVMTVLLIFVNLNTQTNASASAGGFTDRAHHTILAELVTGELGGFMEDEQLIVEILDPGAVMAGSQQSYLDNLSSVHSQAKVSMQEDLDDEDYAIISNLDNSIVRPNIVATKITEQDRTETVVYTVLSGDTISVIAEKFGISVSTILWENDLSSYSIIRPGDNLDILPKTGIKHKVVKSETISSIAKKYDIEEVDLLEVNKIEKNDSLQVGQELFVPGGKKTIYRAPAPTTYTGFTAIKNIVSAPSSQVVSGNKMAWPTSATRITQYYSWRHHGLDIAERGTVPIYASDSGTVESAGWGTGYGYNIVIDHGGGKKTRYAHMSKFYIGAGEKVSKGHTLGLMGNTGWSTGQHLHFEVIINGKKYNPLNYIK